MRKRENLDIKIVPHIYYHVKLRLHVRHCATDVYNTTKHTRSTV